MTEIRIVTEVTEEIENEPVVEQKKEEKSLLLESLNGFLKIGKFIVKYENMICSAIDKAKEVNKDCSIFDIFDYL